MDNLGLQGILGLIIFVFVLFCMTGIKPKKKKSNCEFCRDVDRITAKIKNKSKNKSNLKLVR